MQIVYTSTNFKGALSRAILAIIVGLVLVLWPGVALRYIIMFIGAMFLATGLIAFIVSNKNREDRRRSLVPFSGIGSMALGLLLLCWPSFFYDYFYVCPGVYSGRGCCRPICFSCGSPSIWQGVTSVLFIPGFNFDSRHYRFV